MDTQPRDTEDRASPVAQKPTLDPLRRVFVPIEKRDVHGRWTFNTSDGERYTRDEHGVIRNIRVKVNGKVARKMRRRLSVR
jgi:hypothetical protein